MNISVQVIERVYPTAPEVIWELWTTKAGIERWWSPDGFSTDVRELELRPGGRLVHAMTATGPEQIAFMEGAGLPLTSVATKTLTEVDPPHRLAYSSLVDFVPDVAPYEHLTTVELESVPEGTRVRMTVEPMHDEEWTQRMIAGRTNELENLAAALPR